MSMMCARERPCAGSEHLKMRCICCGREGAESKKRHARGQRKCTDRRSKLLCVWG